MLESKKLIIKNSQGKDVVVYVKFSFSNVYRINKALSTVTEEGTSYNDGLVQVYLGLTEHDGNTLISLVDVLSKNELTRDEIVDGLDDLFAEDGDKVYESISELAESSGFLTGPKGAAASYLKTMNTITVAAQVKADKSESTEEERVAIGAYLDQWKEVQEILQPLTGKKQ